MTCSFGSRSDPKVRVASTLPSRGLPGFKPYARAAGTSAAAFPALTSHAKKCVLCSPHACETMLSTRPFLSASGDGLASALAFHPACLVRGVCFPRCRARGRPLLRSRGAVEAKCWHTTAQLLQEVLARQRFSCALQSRSAGSTSKVSQTRYRVFSACFRVFSALSGGSCCAFVHFCRARECAENAAEALSRCKRRTAIRGQGRWRLA